MNMHFNRNVLPFILFFIVTMFLYQAIMSTPTGSTQMQSVSKMLPTFAQSSVLEPEKVITERDLLGQVSLLHIWASWCGICSHEQVTWMEIAKKFPYPIYGLNYKDELENAQHWLMKHGNPFQANIYDPIGQLAFEWGVRGTPETFLIDPYGTVVGHIQGPITLEWFEQTVEPFIKQIPQENL